MPYKKVPVVHKFGIISSSQRIELQERLLKQSLQQNNNDKKVVSTQRNALQVTEQFINSFNNAASYRERAAYEEKARKMLERSKRRSGLRSFGKGPHVDIALAWSEMAQLAQCNGKIQDDCLDVLMTSLDVSPLERYHIAALFFLAETVLYWLQTDSLHQKFLRKNEINFLKMGQLVFERLFYHHMAGQLQLYTESKMRLNTYMEGLQNYLELYNAYPNVLLSFKFILEAGKIILADLASLILEAKDEGKPTSAQKQNRDQAAQTLKSNNEKPSQEDGHSVWSAAISSSVHDLSPTLWHALDVWRCTNGSGGGKQEALKALARCGLGLAQETWIDGAVALQILGDAARSDIAVLDALFVLARGLTYFDQTSQPEASGYDTSESESTNSSKNLSSTNDSPKELSLKSSLSDIDERSEEREISTTDSCSKPNTSPKVIKSNSAELFKGNNEAIADDMTQEDNAEEMTINTENVVRANENPSRQVSEKPGLLGWHWEVALTYVDVLADVILYGSSASIQKYALVGSSKNVDTIMYRGANHLPFESPGHSAGLLDIVFFTLDKHEAEQDWSWQVRYHAVLSLRRISHCLLGDTLREGLSTTLTSILDNVRAIEKDLRVLEALKVDQIQTDKSKHLGAEQGQLTPSLGGQIANCLSSIYLPPVPPPVVETPAKNPGLLELQSHYTQTKHFNSKDEEMKPLRTSIKQEIQLASPFYEAVPDYYTRKSFDLRRIVEDQWRKELQASLAETEDQELVILVENQKNEETRQVNVAKAKFDKFHKINLQGID